MIVRRCHANTGAGLALLVLLGGCASAPTYGPTDEQALAPIRKAHMTCLMNQTQALIHGSDDVAFLTRHIAGQCDGELQPMAAYLRGRKFSEWTIGELVDKQRKIGLDATADVILRVKAAERGPSDGYR